MDTHKDFIHIDDVFKDLRNGEEKEPSGAWLRMKDLLDKEMPAGAPVSAGKSFRRYIVPLVALLLAGGGFTYYKLNQNSKNAAPAGSTSQVVALHTSGNTGTLTSTGSDHTTPSGTGQHSSDNRDIAGAQDIAANSNNATTTGNSPETGHSGKVSDRTQTGTSHTTTSSATTSRPSVSGNRQASTGKARSHGAVAASGHNRKADIAANTTVNAPVAEQRVIEEIKPKPAVVPGSADQIIMASARNNADPISNKENNLKEVATTLNNKKIVQASSGKLYKEVRDTFKRIDVVVRTTAASSDKSKIKTTFDTVAITRVEKVSYVPLNTLEMTALHKMKVSTSSRHVLPIANLKEKIVSNEMVSMVPLAHYKVASRRVDPGKFNQLIQNTSQGISNYFDGSRNFYAAILLGGNSSFGNPGAFGLQFGIAGLYQLNERLTLAAELKYVNHYFSNYSLDDKSVTFENVNSQQLSGAEWLFSGTQKTSTSAYKINSFGALEMPVTLNYNLGRVSIFGGLNMAYGLPIKWNKENTLNVVEVQKNSSENTNPFLNTSAKVDEQNDFSSRFGVGYVWGLNYDFSRKISLDARLAQILWDNSKGNTDAIKRLFQVPTLQVSIGYFFGRKDKVVYIMDKR